MACDTALVFHGGVILLISQFSGYAYFRAINAAKGAGEAGGTWRMSHAATSAGAVFLVALAPVLPELPLRPVLHALLAGSFVVSSYAFCLGTVLAALSGRRGTRPEPPLANLAVYVLYVIGAIGSTVAGPLFVYGAGLAYFAGAGV